VLVLDMIEIHPPLGKYKYDTWIILSVKCYIDNYVRLRSSIRNINTSRKSECGSRCLELKVRCEPIGNREDVVRVVR
jgi:hypothetical protein